MTDQTDAEKMEVQTIAERDAAEAALSEAYALVSGQSPEWSNMFGYQDALDQIEWRLNIERSALSFYAEHGAGCRLVHSGGDDSRNALAADGGKKAKSALLTKDTAP